MLLARKTITIALSSIIIGIIRIIRFEFQFCNFSIFRSLNIFLVRIPGSVTFLKKFLTQHQPNNQPLFKIIVWVYKQSIEVILLKATHDKSQNRISQKRQ